MTYDVILTKQVHSCFATFASTDVWLEYAVSLPIAPFVGLGVAIHGLSEEIKEVWIKDAGIVCYVDSDRTLYEEDLALKRWFGDQRDDARLQEIVAEYVAQGWHVRA